MYASILRRIKIPLLRSMCGVIRLDKITNECTARSKKIKPKTNIV